ncbi:MAG TPA: nuclear transport factor 2 family protein [Gammaproteobacteria bacterium]|nr:nuclear transport factor 2 family protein [Gammaproteobacteria bacterium]
MQIRTFGLLAFAVTALALAAFVSISRAPAQSSELDRLAAAVQILEDREEIRALIMAYGAAHDARDYRAFADLFADNDGEWVGGLGSAKGREAIFELMDRTIGHDPQPGGSGTYHIMTNDQIVIDADRASAVTKWIYLTPNAANNPQMVFLGHYDDRFVRENGRWKFLRREAPVDIAPPQNPE